MKVCSKKVAVVMLILVLTLSLCASAFAESVEPRWKELSTVYSSLERKSGIFSNANVYAGASSWNNTNTISLTVTIQKWNGSSYVDTSYTWSSSAKGSTSVDKDVKLEAGNYRAHTVVTVYNSSGAYVETVTSDSSELIM